MLIPIDGLGGHHQRLRVSLKRHLGGEEHAQSKEAGPVTEADSHQAHVGRGINGGRNGHHFPRKAFSRKRIGRDRQLRSHADLAEIERGDVSEELDFTEAGNLEERRGGGAINLLASAGEPLDDGSREGRAHFRPRQLQPGESQGGVGLAQRRLAHTQLRASVFQVLARGDAPLEQALVPIAVQARIVKIRLGQLYRGFGLLELVEEGPVLDLGERVALSDLLSFGHHRARDASRDERADFDVSIGQRRYGPGHSEG